MLGVICGGLEITIMQPTLYWKNCFQQNLPISFHPKIFYRGIIPSIANNSAMIGSQFGIAGYLKKQYLEFFGKDPTGPSIDAVLFGSFMAGYFSGFWCGPMELAMIQQQRFGMTLSNCLKKIVKEYGIRFGVFRGTFNTSMREGIWV